MKNWLVEFVTFLIILAIGYVLGFRDFGLIIWIIVGLFVDWLWWDGIVPGLEFKRKTKELTENAKKKG
ncbi:hypothetical protein M1271_02320 [Patescibacteria group bacterium]|nr:hypothetical protein [Patescibacteria group bacterium]